MKLPQAQPKAMFGQASGMFRRLRPWVQGGQLTGLTFDDGSFDVVVNECAVGLTADPQKGLAEMARVAKTAGYVVIRESTWLKKLPNDRAEDVDGRRGTVPHGLDEWKGMMESVRGQKR